MRSREIIEKEARIKYMVERDYFNTFNKTPILNDKKDQILEVLLDMRDLLIKNKQ